MGGHALRDAVLVSGLHFPCVRENTSNNRGDLNTGFKDGHLYFSKIRSNRLEVIGKRWGRGCACVIVAGTSMVL